MVILYHAFDVDLKLLAYFSVQYMQVHIRPLTVQSDNNTTKYSKTNNCHRWVLAISDWTVGGPIYMTHYYT